MRTWKIAGLVFLSLAPAFAASIVLPNNRTSTLGNDSSGSLAGSLGDGAFQHVWVSSQFPSGGSDLLITQLAFRLKPGTGAITATATSFSLSLSTTTVTPATMSTTFAANRGADFTQVASGTGTLWSSPGCTALVTCPFDIVYSFSTPFRYNPANGSLLIELQFAGYNGTGSGQFDVENYAINPPVGELVGSPSSPAGSLEYSDNITQLSYTLVPEPASCALVLCGAGMLLALQRRRSESHDMCGGNKRQ